MNSTTLRHAFDLDPIEADLDLFAEELPEQKHFVSDCASTASSFSTAKCVGSFSTMGSIISCG